MEKRLLEEQLQQLVTVIWDGNLISKEARDELVREGFCQRDNGWNLLTLKGFRELLKTGYLRP